MSPWSLEILDEAPVYDQGPPLQARAAFVADLDRGEVLLAQDADAVWPIASLTKLVSALALIREEPDLDQVLCVGPEVYPTRSGARSRFETGRCHVGWDWLGAALVASDNRAAMGLIGLADLPWDLFLEAMHDVGRELGMAQAGWVEPTGLEVGDQASARDLARAAVAVAAHPVLGPIASAPIWAIQREQGLQLLHTTNKLVDRFETLAAKTGYTDPAQYCLALVVRSDAGSTYVVVVLGAPSSGARFADAERLVEWADAVQHSGPVPSGGSPKI